MRSKTFLTSSAEFQERVKSNFPYNFPSKIQVLEEFVEKNNLNSQGKIIRKKGILVLLDEGNFFLTSQSDLLEDRHLEMPIGGENTRYLEYSTEYNLEGEINDEKIDLTARLIHQEDYKLLIKSSLHSWESTGRIKREVIRKDFQKNWWFLEDFYGEHC